MRAFVAIVVAYRPCYIDDARSGHVSSFVAFSVAHSACGDASPGLGPWGSRLEPGFEFAAAVTTAGHKVHSSRVLHVHPATIEMHLLLAICS